MSTPDQAPAAISPNKRPYQTPQVTDLGDVRAITRSGGSSSPDFKTSLNRP